jgi:hypothetical protein
VARAPPVYTSLGPPEEEVVRKLPLVTVACLLIAAALPAPAQTVRTSRSEWFVPWKVLNPGTEPPRAVLILYWIPNSRDDLRKSELMTSRELVDAAGDCVSLQIIRPEDVERVEKIREKSPLPFAVLTDGNGRELARVDSVAGILPAGALAALITDEQAARLRESEKMLADARRLQAEGDRAGAIELLERVEASGCVVPRQAKTAAKLLRKLRGH